MRDQLMSRAEITRRLRMVVSQKRGHRPLNIQTIAVRSGLSRRAFYNALHGDMGDIAQHVLSQVLAEVPLADMIADSAGLRRC